jgi:hypothetical protein
MCEVNSRNIGLNESWSHVCKCNSQQEYVDELKYAVRILLDIIKECYPDLCILNFEKLIEKDGD